MSETPAALQAHAFVDQSLEPAERDVFEAAMRRDVRLRARVEAWEAQNEAIRLAFGAAPRPKLAPVISRPSNENAARFPENARKPRSRPPRVFSRPIPWPAKAALAALALAGGIGWVVGAPADPRPELMRRAEIGLRAAFAFPELRLDFASEDPKAAAAWLGPRFARLDPRRLKPPGWSLLGVRVAPGLAAPAAWILYEDALGGRAALMVEPTDGLRPRATLERSERDETAYAGVAPGFAYAAVGPTRSGVGALLPAGD